MLTGRELNTKQFLWWFFKAIFQAFIIMLGSLFLFGDKIFLKIVTVTFSELILAEILNVYTEINKFHVFMIVSFCGTAIVYALTLFLFPSILDVYFIFEWEIIWKILVIAIISWLPFYLFSIIKSSQKLMKN